VLSSRTTRGDDVLEFDLDSEILELLLKLLARRSCVVRDKSDVFALLAEERESFDDVFGAVGSGEVVSVEGSKRTRGESNRKSEVGCDTYSLSPAGPVQMTPSHCHRPKSISYRKSRENVEGKTNVEEKVVVFVEEFLSFLL